MSGVDVAARVWLVAGLGTALVPVDRPTVRDDLMRVWEPGPDGGYFTGGGRHNASWGELRARYDLVEVSGAPVAEVVLAVDG
ncbi:MAG: hypothetical protein ACRDR6_02695 [Pseudonocardiaceae bacterium]